MQINLGARKIHCKIVYYGPGCSGKTTNIQKVHEHMPKARKSDLTSIATEGDRTLFFDFMSLDLGQVMGMDTCFQLYTVPGQVYYNATRKLVLQGVDGLVFVADCSPDRFEANMESWRDLVENLTEYNLTLDDIPVVIQFNKRDVPGAVPTEKLNEALNKKGFKTFEAVACRSEGVLETLKSVCSSVIGKLSTKGAADKGLARTMATAQIHPASHQAGAAATGHVAPAKTLPHLTKPAGPKPGIEVAATATTAPIAATETIAPMAATATIEATGTEGTATMTAHPEKIAKVSLDYTPPATKRPAPHANVQTPTRSWKNTRSAAERDAEIRQFSGGRTSTMVKPTGSKEIIGRIEAKGHGHSTLMKWVITLGGLAAAGAIVALVLYTA